MDNKTLDIFEAMNELYESAQNNLILICNKQLFKNLKNKNWKDIQLSHKSIKELNELLKEKGKQILENMQESTLNAFKVAGIKPDKTLIATNEKAMGVVIGSARQYYKGSVTKIWRLNKTDDLYNTILEQSKVGIEKGLPIKINNRNYEFKSYMEMKVRTTISHQIVEQQMELNLDTQNVFFIVNYFGDCAEDHKDLQGKIYYDDRYKSFTIPKEVKQQVANIISQKKLMSMQEAIEKPYWLTTRPNCRHRFVPITIDQALGSTNALLEKMKLKKGTYKDAKYQASQQLRAAERNIRKYKALLNQYQEIYKTGQNSKVLPFIDKYKGLVKKWQKQARIIVDDANSKGYKLERDYRRETRKVIVKDLGVKYNGDDGKPPMQEPEVVIEPPKVKKATTIQEAREILTNDLGFIEIEDSFNRVDPQLQVDIANQLNKLDARFGAIKVSKGTISANASGNTGGYVKNSPSSPDIQNLSFNNRDSREITIKSIKNATLNNWHMPCSEENYSIYTTTHEYGHMLENIMLSEELKKKGLYGLKRSNFSNEKEYKNYLKKIEKTCKEFEKQVLAEIKAIAKEKNPNFSIKENISEYGLTNIAEFFAEVFANSQLGQPNELGEAMEEWLKRRGY